MSWVILLLAGLALILLERLWGRAAAGALRLHGVCDRILAEPEEPVTWSVSVDNPSRLPIPFVRLHEYFPLSAEVRAEEAWVRVHCRKSLQAWTVEEKLSLRPRQRSTRSVSLSFPRRGAYQLGGCRLSVGDLLGVRELSRESEGQTLVVIPRRARSRAALEALGGFLGDVSVRRFILEDPVLTVGFRDYTGREPLKAISWKRTAVTGRLQVKQYDHTAERTVMILFNAEGGTRGELERCFELIRTVCEELERRKIPFGLRTNGNLPGPVGKIFHLAEGLGESHLNAILYALGRADYTCFHSFRHLVGQTLLHRKHNESYLVVTPALTGDCRGQLGRLERAVGGPLCVLTGEGEEEP